MNRIYSYILSEYSAIISVVGTILGFVLTIAGNSKNKKHTRNLGIGLLVFFILFSFVIIMLHYNEYKKQETSTSPDPAYTSSPEGSNPGEPVPAPTLPASPEPTVPASPEPTVPASSETVADVPNESSTADAENTSTPEPQPTSTVRNSPEPLPSGSSAADADTTPAPGAGSSDVLEVAAIPDNSFTAAMIAASEESVPPAEIETVSGYIASDGQKDPYPFTPGISGIYRFFFSDVADGTDFRLSILSSGNELLKSDYNLDDGDGLTAALTGGKSYIIQVEQYRNTGSYTLNFGKQKQTVDISQLTAVSDSIQYTDQENIYSFAAQYTGLHRFEFSDVPDGTDLKLFILNSGLEQLKYDYDLDNGDGLSVSLTAGKTYYVKAVQYRNTGTYTLNIGVKKMIPDISSFTTIHDSIQYTDQENDYSFTAVRDGLHRFEFSDVPDGTDLKLFILNSGLEQLKYDYDLDNGDGLDVLLTAGQTCYIRAVQYRKTGSYTLNVGIKKECLDISGYTAVRDSSQYTDQENDYSFTAASDGIYRFEFSDVPEGTDYKLFIFNSGWEQMKYDYDLDNGDGLEVSLSGGQTCFVRVCQYRNYGNYQLNILSK